MGTCIHILDFTFLPNGYVPSNYLLFIINLICSSISSNHSSSPPCGYHRPSIAYLPEEGVEIKGWRSYLGSMVSADMQVGPGHCQNGRWMDGSGVQGRNGLTHQGRIKGRAGNKDLPENLGKGLLFHSYGNKEPRCLLTLFS